MNIIALGEVIWLKINELKKVWQSLSNGFLVFKQKKPSEIFGRFSNSGLTNSINCSINLLRQQLPMLQESMMLRLLLRL